MEFDDWGPVIFHRFRSHHANQEAVAKALSVALMGDDKDWQQHMTNARRYMDEMSRTMPPASAVSADKGSQK